VEYLFPVNMFDVYLSLQGLPLKVLYVFVCFCEKDVLSVKADCSFLIF